MFLTFSTVSIQNHRNNGLTYMCQVRTKLHTAFNREITGHAQMSWSSPNVLKNFVQGDSIIYPTQIELALDLPNKNSKFKKKTNKNYVNFFRAEIYVPYTMRRLDLLPYRLYRNSLKLGSPIIFLSGLVGYLG